MGAGLDHHVVSAEVDGAWLPAGGRGVGSALSTTHSNPSFVPNIPGSLASTLGGNFAACAAPPRGRLGARPDAPAAASCRPPQRRCDAVALVTEQHNGFLAGLARLAGEIHGCHSHGSKTAALRGRQGTKTCGGGVRNGGQSASAGRSGSGESARGFTNLRWHKCGGVRHTRRHRPAVSLISAQSPRSSFANLRGVLTGGFVTTPESTLRLYRPTGKREHVSRRLSPPRVCCADGAARRAAHRTCRPTRSASRDIINRYTGGKGVTVPGTAGRPKGPSLWPCAS